MGKIYFFLFLLSGIGLFLSVSQIYRNTYHNDIFDTKNRGTYNIQRHIILESKDADSLKNIAL